MTFNKGFDKIGAMLSVGVIGIGKLGSIHLRIYKEINKIGKIYLVDKDQNILNNLNDQPSFEDYQNLKGKVDLVSIATPTSTHFEIAKFFLKNRVPVLVEKPLAQNLEEAEKLISLSKKMRTLLFVGHVERYNSAYLAVKEFIKKPLFIECHRLSTYPNRSLDISVVLDLMIHDLDIVLDLVKDPLKKVQAKGVKVLSPSADIANVRLEFKKGCVANITSSRISAKKERKIRIFTSNLYVSLDYANQEVEIYQKTADKIERKSLPINKEEPLKKEISEFIKLVEMKKHKTAYAEKAKDALGLARKIERIIKK